MVDRIYCGGQFAVGEGVKEDYPKSVGKPSGMSFNYTHVGRKYDGRWWEVQFSGVEWLCRDIDCVECI